MNYCKYCFEPSGTDDVCPKCLKETSKVVPPHRLIPGTLLVNRYRIGKVLGEGGFGITYIGLDTKLNMKVAVKEYYPNGLATRNNTFSSVVSCSASDDKQEVFLRFRDKFLQEARTLAKFSKEKSIVEVRDFFETNNTAYIIMEYLDGQDLREFQRTNGNMPVEKAIQVLTPVMRTLGKIHQQGLIHRDISPDNIRLTPDGVKLLDFGAAREMNTQINRSISVMLKPGYAPEEQYRSKGVQGPWTDVYAVCATIYKCITGVTPDDATQRVFSDELKKPSSYGIKISPAVEEVLLKGMSVFQKDRYKSMDELITALTNALQNRRSSSSSKVPSSDPSLDKTVSVDSLHKNKNNSQGNTGTSAGSSQTSSAQKKGTSGSSVNPTPYPTPPTPPTPTPPTPTPPTPTPPTPPTPTPIDRSIPYIPHGGTSITTAKKKKKNTTPFVIIGIAAIVAIAICIFIVFYSKDSGNSPSPDTPSEQTPITQTSQKPSLDGAEDIVSVLYDYVIESDVKKVNSYEILDWSYISAGVDSLALEISGSNSISAAYNYISSETGLKINNSETFLDYWFSEPDDFRSIFEETYGNNFSISCSDFSSRFITAEEGAEYISLTKNEISENYSEYIDPNGMNVNAEYFAEVECSVTFSGTYKTETVNQIAVLGYVNGSWKIVYIEDNAYSPYYLMSLTMLTSCF